MPTNKSFFGGTSVLLAWNTAVGAEKYGLRFSTDSTFNNVLIDTVITETFFQLSNLSDDQQYFWTVQSQRDSSFAEWSTPWWFSTGKDNPKFTLHENGITIVCDNAEIGETGVINGTIYTKRNKSQITPSNAASTCTSGITDMSYLFFKDFFNAEINHWDVSKVTNMSYMFYRSISFNQDISSWDVSSVEVMSFMFQGATMFNQDIGSWDVSNVNYMKGAFYSAKNFNQDISSWDVSNVKDMSQMFESSGFNQNIGDWDVSNVSNMNQMFYRTTAFNQDLSNWCVPLITKQPPLFATLDTSFMPKWGRCSNGIVLDEVQLISPLSWNRPYSEEPVLIWQGQENAKQYDIQFSNDDFQSMLINETVVDTFFVLPTLKKGQYYYWRVRAKNESSTSAWSRVWGFELTGENPKFKLHENGITIVCDEAAIGEGGTVNGRTYIRRSKEQINEWNASLSCTSGITDMSELFKLKQNFNQNIAHWDVSNVTSMNEMFYEARKFNQALENWDVSNVTGMSQMFYLANEFNQDLSNWCVFKISSEPYRFSHFSLITNEQKPIWGACPSLYEVVDIDLISPSDSVEVEGLTPTLSWQAIEGVDGYQLEVMDVNTVVVKEIVSQNSYVLPKLKTGNFYRWGVRAIKDSVGVAFSEIRVFNTTYKNNNFYLASNGLTVICENAEMGESAELNGSIYKKRIKKEITQSNAYQTCTSGITDMSDLFERARNITDITHWDVSNVQTLERMFQWTGNFNQDIGNWDVSNVVNMSGMFWRANNFNQDIGNWDVSSVVNMSEMFSRASNFNQDIGNWDVSNVVNMSGMFSRASNFNQDLSNWCVSNISSDPGIVDFSGLEEKHYPIWGTCPTNTSIDEEEIDLPTKTELLPNYPNPFNPSTTIQYNLSAASKVTLEVFNLNGERINQLVNSNQSAGNYRISFNAANLPSGVYLYRLTTDNQVFSKKMLLLK